MAPGSRSPGRYWSFRDTHRFPGHHVPDDWPRPGPRRELASGGQDGVLLPPHPRERTRRVSSTAEIQSGLAEILEEVAGVTPADATPEKSFTDDLDVDSLSMVEIATAVEDKFGVAIPDDELGNIKTVGDAISFIEKNQ